MIIRKITYLLSAFLSFGFVQSLHTAAGDSRRTASPGSFREVKKIVPEPWMRLLDDGSYTVIDNKQFVELYDQPNDIIIKIYKVNNLQKNLCFSKYTRWVKGWIDDPDRAMEDQGYNDPFSDRFQYHDTAKIIHGFTPLIDGYINICGTDKIFFNTRKSRFDTSITIDAEIIDSNKNIYIGFFEYIIDGENAECYHRNFVQLMPTRNLLQKPAPHTSIMHH